MKLLVTGGAGFIGSNFIHYWFREYPEDSITNLDKLTYAGNLENLKDLENNPNYTFIKGDICDNEIVNKAMHDVDVVVHFAAESHVDRSIQDSSPFIHTNVVGTHILLESALQHKKIKRFHHISTDEVFGSLELGTHEKFDENTPYNPRSPYSASKAAADHLVRAYHITYGLPVSLSNCSNNYGPYCFPEKLFSLAITNLLEEKKVPIYGDGLNVRDWLYVEDHARAIDLILKKGKVGETYFIGGLNEDVSNIEVIRMILRIMGKSEDSIEFVKDRLGHDRKYAIDWSKIKNELGWEPKMTLENGLSLTVKWYTENQDWWKKLK
ncbi:dTDP-glucose 4,6-dehydratase [Candidatus Roizmanbacteria bacterium RIFCSPLOWO2_02_FULL_37_19]|uniref:dTDP-glucose 4,6-dehydratase n=1 Tax=Candidatus Roizmanbacteria bacterium RIFCSPHIGHO2_02_FULL_37_24 TaxID=1802037 RepID=A0A1F7GWY9_9BACT|nr:MAG: dTDP-glucose 4,6-dehydratase [Candidatus Roizmanbacteria bacterium RIFCSPHIGHO2_01_FULL_38_41]OGK23620.1 MAG: dTDP-glucose 4,6-dehydratase [Candidatus Roizmanbacteria bacterium RIFCSPHIGHO2_02_FULL_37_24]OGK32943.1 MAG: dTDP-glucose 4,6-dehydratase [Candidatus Roizmanbacteria bacterium RIFCSPHIGHO2_12_FULL_37_23]OGK44004.1 MAG: dTDP-glucose 4,6-dehydratase [Candidatus Roizmanbacteria bacterium RIFCSPLOWO2_01_FULL_37_57]OGK54651.1 MAG: dTDP-glucose 4,6-dehydratase [Candidatus Roizmanbact